MIDLAALLDEIKVARLQPGDVIMVKTPGGMERDVLIDMYAEVKRWFPGHDVRFTVGVDIEVIRPERVKCRQCDTLNDSERQLCRACGDPLGEIVRPDPEVCAYGHIRTWTSAVCQVCGELQEDPPPATLVRFEEGSLDWGDGDPCAHSGDPCEKCGKPFPLRNA